MTVEEVALEEFREAVSGVRLWRRNERRFLARLQHVKEPDRIATLAVDIEAARCGKSEAIACVRSLARIIRAIRAERTPFHAMEKRLAGSIEGGIETGIALIKARAYAQGRRDALRGVQGACLFEIGRMEERQKKYGGASWDWEGYPEDMRAYDVLCEVAEFAEEAAR